MNLAYGHVRLLACPPSEEVAVRDALVACDFYDAELPLGLDYDAEVAADLPDRLVEMIARDAPGTTLMAWTEDGGAVAIAVPGLGIFRAACDDAGDPVFGPGELRELLTLDPADRDRRLGTAHYAAIAALLS